MSGNDDAYRLGARADIRTAVIGRPQSTAGIFARQASATVGRSLCAQAPLIIISLTYLAAALAFCAVSHQALRFGLYGEVQLAFFLNLAVVCLVGRILRTLLRQRPARPLRPVWTDLVGEFALGRRLANAVPAVILLPLVLSAYTSLKTTMTHVAPFAWDASLAAADAHLHGGAAPWALLQPLLGEAAVTRWIDWAYGPVWFWMLLVLQFWQTFSLDAERARVLATFVLSWALLGTAMAMTFASAGPVYYGAFVSGPDPFAPLLTYLDDASRTAPLLAVQAQAALWQAFLAGEVNLAAGISAMPSMHLSMGTLLVLATWRFGAIVRGVACAYLAVLLLGSIHLAWHYAIDSYAAIAATCAIWWVVGRLLAWWNRRARFAATATKEA